MEQETTVNCPGEFGTDYNIYSQCKECEALRICKNKHRSLAEEKRKKGYPMHFLKIPRGIIEEPITHEQKIVLSLVIFTLNPDWGYSTIKQRTIAETCCLTEPKVSKAVHGYTDRGKKRPGLIELGYLNKAGNHWKPTLKTMRLWTAYDPEPGERCRTIDE